MIQPEKTPLGLVLPGASPSCVLHTLRGPLIDGGRCVYPGKSGAIRDFAGG